MKKKSIDRITVTVVAQFPELNGVRPSVRRQAPPGDSATLYLLTYRATARLPTGKSLGRLVRVVADEDGNVLRISTSR